MIGKGRVQIGVKLNGVEAQFAEKARRHEGRHRMARIDHHLPFLVLGITELFFEDADVRVNDIFRPHLALPLHEILFFDSLGEGLDVSAVKGSVGELEFETVVLGGVVGSGDGNAGVLAKVDDSEIKKRRGNQAEVEDVDSA